VLRHFTVDGANAVLLCGAANRVAGGKDGYLRYRSPPSRQTIMKTLATHRDLVVSYLLAMAGVPFPIKPILLPVPARSM